MSKKTLVIGASKNENRASSHAIRMLKTRQLDIIAWGRRPGLIHDVPITIDQTDIEDVNTITLYNNPNVQQGYEDIILRLKPKRVIFNPGTENPAFAKKLRDHDIEVIIACTLVMISTDQY